MGIEDSPLRDRVLFVQGAPRSGTTWLVMLLATHPQIAGVETESHLFEYGVDRLFDNFEFRHRHLRGLTSYVEREELVDLVRELCDGVLLRMRSHVAGGEVAEFVVEKTPTSLPQGTLDLQRKRECYPDAWYLHIVRDGEAVTRSLMRSPFMVDRSREASHKLWSECVGFTREVLGDHPRYREVSYEALRSDPGRTAAELFEWLGLDAGDEVLDTVRTMSRERFSELGAPPPPPDSQPGGRLVRAGRRARRIAGAAIGRVETSRKSAQETKPEVSENDALAFYFVQAFRGRDAEALRSMTTDSLTLTYRSEAGDLIVEGDEARDALVAISESMYRGKPASEWLASAPGGPRVWWTRGRGQEFWTILFSNIGGDASRVDLAMGLTPEGGRVAAMVLFGIGLPAGRPSRRLEPGSLGVS